MSNVAFVGTNYRCMKKYGEILVKFGYFAMAMLVETDTGWGYLLFLPLFLILAERTYR